MILIVSINFEIKYPLNKNKNENNTKELVKTEYIYQIKYKTKYKTTYRNYTSYYKSIHVSQEDKGLLAKLVFLEARGQPKVGQKAIVEVVLNRVLDPRFPNTIYSVIYQQNQFATAPYIQKANPTQVQYNCVDSVLNEIYPILDASTVYFSTFPQTRNITAIINDHYFCS